MTTIWQRHRGPYALNVLRASRNKYGAKTTTEMRGVDSDEVEELARMLLEDPRDKVLGVYVWSEREEQFVTSFSAKREGKQAS